MDSQSTMDLFCNLFLAENINKYKSTMPLRRNSGTVMASHKAKVPGYHMHVWLIKNATTNIVSLKNLGDQYLVTYRSDEKMFIVHRETEVKQNMQFRMHKNGLHYFDPRDEAFTLFNTVSENMKHFTRRQIKDR